MKYIDQLRHPNWQRRRLEALQKADFTCSRCGDTEMTLNVHHKRYVKGRMAWEYDLNELEVLCEPCHGEAHEDMEAMRAFLAAIPSEMYSGLIAVMAGHLMATPFVDPGEMEQHRQSSPAFFHAGVIGQRAVLSSADHFLAVSRFCRSEEDKHGAIGDLDSLLNRLEHIFAEAHGKK